MIKVLILYPEIFKCYSKFSRKVKKILSDSDAVELIYTSDENNFIRSVAEELSQINSVNRIEGWGESNITHAIIFDDGEEFSEATSFIKNKAIPLRLVKIPITRVVNIKRETQYKGLKSTAEYEYIGRGSYWGNPYSMHEEGEEREEVIRKYKYDFDFDKFPNKEKCKVYDLAGKRLGCFCKPDLCHGDILADFLNSWDDGK